MTTHGKRHAKQDIMDAAWKLFTEQGYDETTIAQIIELSGNSRSTFYHHFRGKDELLFSLAYSYDSDYDSWLQTCDRTLPAADLLLAFNHFVLNNLEHSPYMDLFAPLYGLQVATTGTRHILNPDRNYYKILRKILFDGIKCGKLKSDYSYVELSQMITSAQIGLTYSWCLTQRSFSLLQYGESLLTPFIESLRVN